MNARITEAIILLSGLHWPIQATQYDRGPPSKVRYFVRGFSLGVYILLSVCRYIIYI